MNCSGKEPSLIRTTENLLCCVFILIFFLPDQGDEGWSCKLSTFSDAWFKLKNHTVLNFFGQLDMTRFFIHGPMKHFILCELYSFWFTSQKTVNG